MFARVGLRGSRALLPNLSNNSISVLSRQSAIRVLSTVKVTEAEEQSVIIAQRKNRPCSPHLTIYEPQLTWIVSSFHRITGVGLAAGFYGLTCTYAFSSLLGIPFDSATLVSLVAGLPVALKLAGKAIASFPFAFHVANGFRHLAWDSGKFLTVKQVYTTGYSVLAFTAVVGTYLALL